MFFCVNIKSTSVHITISPYPGERVRVTVFCSSSGRLKMRSAIVALAFAGSASAFMAPKIVSSSVSLSATDYSGEPGVVAPTGFFDPLGLSADIPEETFALYRTAEMKHGRVAQLAVLGYIVPEVFRWPGEIAPGLKFADIPSGVAAINAIPAFGWIQIAFLVGAVDYYGVLGNFPSGKKIIANKGDVEKTTTQELQHGRLAMLATMELFRHDSQNLMKPGFDGLDHLITGLPFLYK
jgi:hypothetical protein